MSNPPTSPLSLSTEIQRLILDYVFGPPCVSILNNAGDVAVVAPEYTDILYTCRKSYDAYAPIYRSACMVVLGNVIEAIEWSPHEEGYSLKPWHEWKERTFAKLRARVSSDGFIDPKKDIAPLLQTPFIADRLLRIRRWKLWQLEAWAVLDLAEMLPPGTIKQFAWIAEENLRVELTREATLPADAPISKSIMLEPRYDHYHDVCPGDEVNFRLITQIWSVLSERCGADVHIHIDFHLRRYVFCDADPQVSHYITTVGLQIDNRLRFANPISQPVAMSSSQSDIEILSGWKSEIRKGSTYPLGCRCTARFHLEESLY